MSEVHVVVDERSTWRVYDAGAPAPASEHTNATEAEFAAGEHDEDLGADRVVVHDRYHRAHAALAWPVGPRARAMRRHPPSRRDPRTGSPVRTRQLPAPAITAACRGATSVSAKKPGADPATPATPKRSGML